MILNLAKVEDAKSAKNNRDIIFSHLNKYNLN